MAMASPDLRDAMERRTRAAYALKGSAAFADTSKSPLSVPAAIGCQTHDFDNLRAKFATNSVGRTRVGLMLPTKNIRMTRSASPGNMRGDLSGVAYVSYTNTDEEEDRTQAHDALDRGMPSATPNMSPTLAQKPRTAPQVPSTPCYAQHDIEVSEDSLSGAGVDEHLRPAGPMAADRSTFGSSQEQIDAVSPSTLRMQEKLMELIEDRDRAVHLCLQYRCKLKSSNDGLRSAETRNAHLMGRMREAAASEEASKRLLDQALKKARLEESHKLRLEARARHDDRAVAGVAEDGHRARKQLLRARKDLRELWLERDELATLAGQTIEYESTCRARTKKLELVIAGFRAKLSSAVLSEKEAVERAGRAEGKAATAEKRERDLRTAVIALKNDFEGLVDDLHSREERLRQLQAENAALVARVNKAADCCGDSSASPRNTAAVVYGQWHSDSPHRSSRVAIATGDERRIPERVCAFGASSREGRDEGCRDGHDMTAEEGGPGTPLPPTFERGISRERKHRSSIASSDSQRHECGQEEGSRRCTGEFAPERKDERKAITAASSSARPSRKTLAPRLDVARGDVPGMPFTRCRSHVPMMTPSLEKDVPDKEDGHGQAVGAKATNATAAHATISPHEDALTQNAQVESWGRVAALSDLGQRPSDEILVGPDNTRPLVSPEELNHRTAEPRSHEAILSGNHDVPALVDVHNTTFRVEKPAGIGDESGPIGDADATSLIERSDGQETSDDALTRRSAARIEADNEATPRDVVGREASELLLTVDAPEEYEAASGVVTRMLQGVPVLKHGSRGKPKAKLLWVTPDLYEIFYTEVRRTSNSKATSRMSLANLRAIKGRGDFPELSHARADCCFALVRDERLTATTNPRLDEGLQGQRSFTSTDPGAVNGRRRSMTAPPAHTTQRQTRWGMGGTGPPNLKQGNRWLRGSRARHSTWGTTGEKPTSPHHSSPGNPERERMGFETSDADECVRLVEEINSLADKAGLHSNARSGSNVENVCDCVHRSCVEHAKGMD